MAARDECDALSMLCVAGHAWPEFSIASATVDVFIVSLVEHLFEVLSSSAL